MHNAYDDASPNAYDNASLNAYDDASLKEPCLHIVVYDVVVHHLTGTCEPFATC